MKRIRLLGKRGAAVFTFLAMCGAMVAPAFAGTFTELQGIINTSGDGRITLAESYQADDGTKSIVIGPGQNITLDLNGYTLTGGEDDSVIQVSGGSLTLEDSSGDDSGTITGGGGSLATAPNQKEYQCGGGVSVTDGGSVVMNGGRISGNSANIGGGVYVDGGDFTLNGGEISGNETVSIPSAGGSGGGVYVGAGSVTMDGGKISRNRSDEIGGGVTVSVDGIFTISSGKISGNTADIGGGVSVSGGQFIMTGGEISENTAMGEYAGGVINYGCFIMSAGVVANNKAVSGAADDILNVGTIVLPEAGSMGAKLDGRDITGWYFDWGDGDDPGWGGTGDHAYIEYGSAYKLQEGCTDILYIKAAHGQYFAVTDDEGNVLAEVEKGTVVNLDGLKPPGREGYTFVGWDVDGGTVTVDGSISLKALWEADKPPEPAPEEPEQPGGTQEPAEPAPEEPEQPGGTQEPVEPAPEEPEQPGGTQEPAEPAPEEPEQPGGIQEPAEPTPEGPKQPGGIGDPLEPIQHGVGENKVSLVGLPFDLEDEDHLTRGQLVAILHWMDGEPPAELASFLDVLTESDYAEAIGWAEGSGIALDMGGNNFLPDEFVTRGQLIDFLNRYAAYVGSNLVLGLDGDADEVLTWGVAKGIINDFFAQLYA